MIVVSIANQKGGEGKTTTSLNLSMGLARRGKRTLLVDIDPQANSTGIFTNPESLEKSMHGVFNSRMTIKEIMIETRQPDLFLVTF